MVPEKKMLTPNEAAEILKCTSSNILNMIKRGKLTASQSLNGRYLIDRCELDNIKKRPDPVPKKETILVKTDPSDTLDEKIIHLQKEVEIIRRHNEQLHKFIEMISSEKLQMLETMTINARLLESKDNMNKSSNNESRWWKFKRK